MPPAAVLPAQLFTFGRLDLRGPDGAPIHSVMQQPKRLALLAYLSASGPSEVHRRDSLLALFWPELDEEHARNALNQAVFRLRRSLGDQLLVSRGNEELGVVDRLLWCDAVAFQNSIAAGREAEALELYSGEFLDGLFVEGVAPDFEHWVDRQRRRLQDAAVASAWRLAAAEEQSGNGAGAARWAWRASEISPSNEDSMGRLIALLDREGDRTGALRAYESFEKRLAADYELEPSEELRARVERIRASTTARSARADAPPAMRARDDPSPIGAKVDVRTRLIVLPFRVLRPDPETDFLAFSLPDAISSSLAGLRSLVVRSNLAALPYAAEGADMGVIATRTEVDVILTGTLLRAGDQVRVSCQLTDANNGRLLWSQTTQAALQDLFELQDQLAHRIVESLALPLTAGEQASLQQDVPKSPRAYELFLRANQVAYVAGMWEVARDLYLESLDSDPDYAPAWSRLGRCYRLIAKYGSPGDDADTALAEDAFRRALRLNPELSNAVNLYAQLEVDLGRAPDAMVRLLWRARTSGGDAELFAGLVHACRFCGLLEASRAAHYQARHLNPDVPTSVAHTYWMLGEYATVLNHTAEDIGYLPALALASLDRGQEAVSSLRAREEEMDEGRARAYLTSLRALLEGNSEESRMALDVAVRNYRDGEGVFYVARSFARLGAQGRALDELERMVRDGFYCYPVLLRDSWLDPLRSLPRFTEILEGARELHSRAAEDYRRAGGDEVLQLTNVQA